MALANGLANGPCQWIASRAGKCRPEIRVIDTWGLISERLARIKTSVQRLFGCSHVKLSLPFTRGADTYRTCVTCGARRRFDLHKWPMVGDFYYPRAKIQLRVVDAKKLLKPLVHHGEQNETFRRLGSSVVLEFW